MGREGPYPEAGGEGLLQADGLLGGEEHVVVRRPQVREVLRELTDPMGPRAGLCGDRGMGGGE